MFQVDPDDLAALDAFLSDPQRPSGTLTLGELRGFLFAVASAPEMVPFPEVFDFILGDDEIVFDTEDDVDRILGCIGALYNQINEGVLNRTPRMPPGVVFFDDPMANFDLDPLSEWSRGFATGHDWLEESWDVDLTADLEEELNASLLALSFFASREAAQRFIDDTEDSDAPALETLAATMAELFPVALQSYAHLGRSIYEVFLELGEEEDPEDARFGGVGRNEPCPCGSGKKFKKCCGANVH